MTRNLPAHSRRPHPRSRDEGFVLMFVLGVLIFLTVLVFGTAYAVRLSAQVAINEKERVQREYVLASALQYTMVQLTKRRAADAFLKTMDVRDAAKFTLWDAGVGSYNVTIVGQEVSVDMEDAGDLPDINILNTDQLKAILRALGASEKEGDAFAKSIEKARGAAAARNGTSGFLAIDELVALEDIPERYRFGYSRDLSAAETVSTSSVTPGADDKIAGSRVPGLGELFSVGTSLTTLNLNKVPVLLIGALGKIESDKLTRFEQARQGKTMTLDAALAILGEPARAVLREGPSPIFRVILRTGSGDAMLQAVAVVREEGGSFRVLSYRVLPFTESPTDTPTGST